MSYNMIDHDIEERKLYCGNLCDKVTKDILYELFLQAGPLERVDVPLNKYGSCSGYAFVTFKHACSVPYAIELFEDTSLFGYFPKLRSRKTPNHNRSQSMPVRFNQNPVNHDNGHNSQVDFDSLLQKSTNMLKIHGAPMGWRTMELHPPVEMGPPMEMSTPMEMGPPMGTGLPMALGPPMRRGQSLGGGQPPPPGEEEPGNDQPWNEQDMNQDKLTQSSLQGNWSARNASHMLPDDRRRSGHHSKTENDYRDRRSGYHQGGNDYDQGGYNQRGYDQGGYTQGGYDQGGYNRSGYNAVGYDYGAHNRSGNRNYGNHRNKRDDHGGYRSRSSDPRERRGNY